LARLAQHTHPPRIVIRGGCAGRNHRIEARLDVAGVVYDANVEIRRPFLMEARDPLGDGPLQEGGTLLITGGPVGFHDRHAGNHPGIRLGGLQHGIHLLGNLLQHPDHVLGGLLGRGLPKLPIVVQPRVNTGTTTSGRSTRRSFR